MAPCGGKRRVRMALEAALAIPVRHAVTNEDDAAIGHRAGAVALS
jgi:hypothetical protein